MDRRFIVKVPSVWEPAQCREVAGDLICGGERLPRDRCGLGWLMIYATDPDAARDEAMAFREA